jgi:hypothetical protein
VASPRDITTPAAAAAAAGAKPAAPPRVRSYSACRRRPTVDDFVRDTTPTAALPAPVAAAVVPAPAAAAAVTGPKVKGPKKPLEVKLHNALAVREPYPTLKQVRVRDVLPASLPPVV